MQETSPGPNAGKAEWRRWLRKILAAINDGEAQSSRIRRQLTKDLSGDQSRCISMFSAIPGEPDLLDLITMLPAHRWVLPRIVGNELAFHQVNHPDQLQTGSFFGIAEPPASLSIVPISEIDLFLCPGLGFDEHGMRLGRGKGFYDRALTKAKPDAPRFGIAFKEQVVPRLPANSHDVPMTRLVTGADAGC